MIDVTQQIDAVDGRSVPERSRPARSRAVTISRATRRRSRICGMPAPSRARIRPVVSSGLRRTASGREVPDRGQRPRNHRGCDPPNSFTATWEFGDEVTWIEVTIEDVGDGRAQLQLEHFGHTDEDRWTEFGPGAVGVGWDGALIGMTLHLASDGAPGGRRGGDGVADVRRGRRFMIESSERWYQANVDAGANRHRRPGCRRSARPPPTRRSRTPESRACSTWRVSPSRVRPVRRFGRPPTGTRTGRRWAMPRSARSSRGRRASTASDHRTAG